MRYNFAKQEEVNQAREYFDKLLSKKAIVEIKQKHPARTYNQNNYLYLLLGYCALEYGESLDGFKNLIFKRYINKDIFETIYTNYKTGEIRKAWRSTAELTTEEMRIVIDRLISFAAKEMGLMLPSSSDFNEIKNLQNEVEINRQYL